MDAATRQLILDFLHHHPRACAQDLSQALSVTRANAQYHLKLLSEAGLIVPVEAPRPARGRPRAYYALTPAVRQNNLPALAAALLDLCLAQPTSPDFDSASFFQSLAARLLPPVQSPLSLTPALNVLIRRLNEMGYQARWEARPSGPQVQFQNCPYAEMISSHPELCQLDAAVLSLHTRRSIEPVELRRPAGSSCRFILHPPSQASSPPVPPASS